MNIIDFHAHYYPDRIAARAVAAMESQSGLTAPLAADRGTLLRSMAAGGITGVVVLPVATNPEKAHSINEKNRLINGKDGIWFAGAIHPDCGDIESELDYIKASGFFGIKIHPDYQNTFFDDPKYIRILEGAASRGLITVTHAGKDPGYPDSPVRCTPERVLHVMRELKGIIEDKLVLAHLGGVDSAAEVLEKLAGLPVWMDTAFMLHQYPRQCLEIIRKHTPEKILFGTDFPWVVPSEYLAILRRMPLTDGELDKILRSNAEKLLRRNREANV